MKGGVTIADNDHVLDQHGGVNGVYGRFLTAVTKPAYRNHASDFVSQHCSIPAEDNSSVQKRLCLRGHGPEINRRGQDQAGNQGVGHEGNDLLEIIFLTAGYFFHAGSTGHAPSDVHPGKINHYRLHIFKFFPDDIKAGYQCVMGRLTGTGTAGNTKNLYGHPSKPLVIFMVPIHTV
jgi:hypothetical protein